MPVVERKVAKGPDGALHGQPIPDLGIAHDVHVVVVVHELKAKGLAENSQHHEDQRGNNKGGAWNSTGQQTLHSWKFHRIRIS